LHTNDLWYNTVFENDAKNARLHKALKGIMNTENLSIRAKTFLAVEIFEAFCSAKGLNDVAIQEFCQYMKSLATASNLPDWDEQASNLAITGLGDPIPADIIEADLINIIACNIREVSASPMYGQHYPEETSRFLGNVVKLCNYSLTNSQIEIFGKHRSEADGWGGCVSSEQLQKWKNVI